MKKFNKLLALLLAIVMVVGVVPVTAFAAIGDNGGDEIVIIAGSDFQGANSGGGADTNVSKANVTAILNRIKADHPQADGMIFCGDYDKNYSVNDTAQRAQINAFKTAVNGVYADLSTFFLVQGNHDQEKNRAGLTGPGGHDADGYSVFIIDEDDYPHKGGDYDTTHKTATALKNYLDNKITQGYNKPIFIASHVPLHYTYRTAKDGDGKYAKLIFDELQAAADAGLTIIFLYGHDHSNGWDNYMGGAAVYLPVNHNILICNDMSAGRSYTTEKLKFTYMNAGFTGYYSDTDPPNANTSGVDDTLTMTCFVIKNGQITVERYDKDNVHNLKSEGKMNVTHENRTLGLKTGLMSDVITSPQTITLPAGSATTEAPTAAPTVAPTEAETVAPRQTFTDSHSGISFGYPGDDTLAFTVGTATVNESLLPRGITNHVAYDITVPGYPTGAKTTVTIPVPSGWDESKTCVYYVNGDKFERLTTSVADGMATFTATHFSTYMLAEGEALTAPVPYVAIPATTRNVYLYTLDTNGVPTNGNSATHYLIVGKDVNYMLGVIEGLAPSLGVRPVVINNNTITLDTRDFEFSITNKNNNRKIQRTGTDSTTYSVYVNDSNSLAYANRIFSWTAIRGNENGEYSVSYEFKPNKKTTNTYRLNVTASGANVTENDNTTAVRLFEYSGVTQVPDQPAVYNYLRMTDLGTVSLKVGAFETRAALEEYLKSLVRVYRSETEDGELSEVTSFTMTASSSIDPTVVTTGNGVTYTVTCDGKTLGSFKVVIEEKTLVSLHVEPMSGYVQRLSNNAARTGSLATLTYDDGSVMTVDVTLGMISGNFDIEVANESGESYTGLTVTCEGLSVTGYSLEVLPRPNEVDYPEYPEEGAVRVTKDGYGINFPSSGVARIELSATGIPMKKGVDIIVMVDTSSSMTYGASDGTTAVSAPNRRIDFLRTALKGMIAELKTENLDGSAVDTRIAIADFNGYTYRQIDPTNRFWNGNTTPSTADNAAKLYTGVNAGQSITNSVLNADAFVDVTTVTDTMINNIRTANGTNYDAAFDTVYKLGKAIRDKNENDGVERDLVVVFMSDGAAFQYNGIAGVSAVSAWNDYIQGTWTQEEWNAMFPNSNTKTIQGSSASISYPYFYNGKDNLHRTAEAIKGNTGDDFDIITFNANDVIPASADVPYARKYMKTVKGLGATLYSIGFCLFNDKQITAQTVTKNLIDIASTRDGQKLFYSSNDGESLNDAFLSIATDIKVAGTKAYFIDKMGAEYDLYTPAQDVINAGLNSAFAPVVTPVITVTTINSRNGAATVNETVTFNADGTEAYCNHNPGVNILGADGIIRANSFFYNTTNAAVAIDHDNDPATPDILLDAESFCWWIGDIEQNRKVLTYYVYLTGSMEGTRPAGVYPTNESAVLYYINWLDHDAHLDTVSPELPWGEAAVNFAFYLVDANGNPIANQSTGLIGTFESRVIVQNKTRLPGTFLLNSDKTVSAAEQAAIYLPNGYTLYDPDAAYTVRNNSDGTGSWTVTRGDGKNSSTYVTDFGGSPTTDLTAENGGYEYSHTTVWFGVLFELKCVPDTVVIDYGKPVDIMALINDRFGNYGSLIAIGERTEAVPASTAERSNGYPATFSKNLTLAHGTATVTGNTVRYTPNGMHMPEAVTFTYVVRYYDFTNSNNPNNGYYFADITIVPATIMYYEESFVTYGGEWTRLESGEPLDAQTTNYVGANGQGSVYGYEAGYAGFGQASDGVQYITTVTAGMTAWPTATFTFTGTGFDIISLTDKLQGFITVQVFDQNGELVTYEEYDEYDGTTYQAPASWGVDCYYGYDQQTVQNGWIKLTYRYTDGWHTSTHIVAEKALTVGEVEVDTLPATGEVGKVYVMYKPNYEWVKAQENVTLYQIPIVKSRDTLTYGTYTVVVTPIYNAILDHVKDDNGYSFIIDAIRIYDPAGVHELATAEGNVNQYYVADGEAWPQFVELRDFMLGQNAFSVDETVKGAVFVDAFGTTDSIATYNNFGPNNEVYLAPGQSVAFRLDAQGAAIAGMHLATKTVNGPVSFTVNGTAMTTATATDLYYDITGLVSWNGSVSDLIVITNTGDSIQSITNIKFTFTAKPSADVVLMTARTDIQPILKMVKTVSLGADVTIEEDTVFNWIMGQRLDTNTTALRKAPHYTPDAKFAVSGIILYVPGETDVINLGRYDEYTTGRIMWVDANGTVIGRTSSFRAGYDVNITELGLNGTRNGAVGYLVSVELTRTVATAPAAFAVLTASSVLHGPVATEDVTEAPVEPAEGTLGWVKGKKYNTTTGALRKAPESIADNNFAVTDVIPYSGSCTVNLGKFDNYTNARVLWVDANGKVIAFSSSFKGGKDVDINTLGFNGTKNGAVGFVLSVQLGSTAATATEAFGVVTEKTVIK